MAPLRSAARPGVGGSGAPYTPAFRAPINSLSQRPVERAPYWSLQMNALSIALELVKRWEGCRLEAYPDPGTGAAPWTIGWGSTGEGIGPGTVWTQEQADERLERDVRAFMAGVQELLTSQPTPHQLGAMTSLAYNIGLGAFGGSTLRRKFNAGDLGGAARQFDRWVYAGGRVMKGLVNRRADERRVFETADFSGVTTTLDSSAPRA